MKISPSMPPSLKSYVKSTVLRTLETKSVLLTNSNVALNNAALTPVFSNLLKVDQGTASASQRIGDKVHGIRLNLRLMVRNGPRYPNVMYRVLLLSGAETDLNVASPPEVFDASVPVSYTSGEVPALPDNQKMLALINTDRYRVHLDKIIQPFGGDYSSEKVHEGASDLIGAIKDGLTETVDSVVGYHFRYRNEHSRYYNYNIPINKGISYQTSSIPEGRNFYKLFVIACDSAGDFVSTVGNIASVDAHSRFTYKDA
jgi:hypothetical protein